MYVTFPELKYICQLCTTVKVSVRQFTKTYCILCTKQCRVLSVEGTIIRPKNKLFLEFA